MRCANFKFHWLCMLALVLGSFAQTATVAQSLSADDGSPSLQQLQGSANDQADEDSQPDATGGRADVDGIAAVVNKDVITFRQLESEVRTARMQLEQQNIPEPDPDTLDRQVLQRMISQTLQQQEADEMGIEVTDQDVQDAVQMIAERNNIAAEQLKSEVTASGLPWDVYLKDLRQDIMLDMLRQRTVDMTIDISDAEVDAFLKTEGKRMAQMAEQGDRNAMPAQPQPQQQQAPADTGSDGPVTVAEAASQSDAVMVGLAHILVAVPEGAGSSQVDELRSKAEGLRSELQSGADFAGVAAASSDGPQALDGGDMGVRPLEGWPDLFLEAINDLKAGDVSEVFKSGNGFHLVKVMILDDGAQAQQQQAQAQQEQAQEQQQEQPQEQQQAPQQPAQPGPGQGMEPSVAAAGMGAASQGDTRVTQTHARHILIETSEVVSDEQAEQRLRQLRDRLSHGEDFADLAKRHSDDSSAPQGGDLGWLTPGETVPSFQRAMDALEPDQVSQPVQSQFGWHLIQVLERRTQDMKEEFERMQARQILFERRVEPALEEWLSQLRGQAYIENRLEPETSSRNKR